MTSPQARMANDIAAQFRYLGERDGAAQVAAHIAKFWDARMVAELVRLAEAGEEDLDPLAATAAALLRAQVPTA